MKRILSVLEILIIVVVAIAPLFGILPYRNNIFLSWEGAYRISEGQIPYKDFGIPVGFMYWLIPAVFFKIFGAQLFTLIKAQAFINLLSGFAFRSIFTNVNIHPGIRFISILVFSLSYTLLNYWPWYNHTVIVYELIALAFLTKYFFSVDPLRNLWITLSGIFVFFSFFSKQDAGAMSLMLCMTLILFHSNGKKRWISLFIFSSAFFLTGLLMILPFIHYNFGYWFNFGQFPHNSRISVADILNQFLASSQWIKFYLLVIVVLFLALTNNRKAFWQDKQLVIATILTLGILAEASIFQVTSYVPVDNNIFFHAFAIAFILYLLSLLLPIDFNNWKMLAICTAGVLLWWSQAYWKYVERFIIKSSATPHQTYSYEGYRYANEVNLNTYMIELDTTDIPLRNWTVPRWRSFQNILLPEPTIDGIERLMNMDIVKNKKDIIVLNMTELTPLAAEIPFQLEKGSQYPLWYHQGVAMFEKEIEMFNDRIRNKYYDLVLFEYIPYLNNFYPFSIRESLRSNYQLRDIFPAPRKPTSHAWVEVYIKK